MNLPNKLTILRIILTFIFMVFLFSQGLAAKVMGLIIFMIAALTDLLDGMIAKSLNQITNFGKIMDPLADKILVLAAFLSFIQLQLIPAWMVIVIIARESIITSLRFFALSRGIVIAASKGGKHKTISQMVAIFIILLSLIIKEAGRKYFLWQPVYDETIGNVVYVSMFLTVVLTLISGASYVWNNRHLFLGLRHAEK